MYQWTINQSKKCVCRSNFKSLTDDHHQKVNPLLILVSTGNLCENRSVSNHAQRPASHGKHSNSFGHSIMNHNTVYKNQ